MKSRVEAFLVGSILICGAGAQSSYKPVLKKGVAVDMPVAGHAIEMREADDLNATVVAITANGKVFVGIQPTEPAELSKLSQRTIYVKADSRVPYQNVLAVLDALRGKSVVLLTAPPDNGAKQGIRQPYGMKLTLPR